MDANLWRFFFLIGGYVTDLLSWDYLYKLMLLCYQWNLKKYFWLFIEKNYKRALPDVLQ